MQYCVTLALYAIVATFFVVKASALNCYICAEGGLEEFGECKTSFPFNCDGYARRYAANEKIFCRTTRHKTFNGTYTVVKECIAESAHHATFARKSQQMDEECDVLDLNGFEVAYCLCRSNDLCNSAPIVDQFTEFENKYPELFDPQPGEASSNEANGNNNAASASADNDDDVDAADQQQQQLGTTTNSNQRIPQPFREQQNSRPQSGEAQEQEQEPNEQNNQEWASTTQAGWKQPPNVFAAPPRPVEFEGTVLDRHSAEENKEEEATEQDTGAFVTSPNTPSSSRPTTPLGRPNSAVVASGADSFPLSDMIFSDSNTGTGSQLGLLPELQCMQCNEQGLIGQQTDCSRQNMVNCPDQSKQIAGIGRPLCFIKQIGAEFGVSVEKKCTTERAILNELGGREAADLLNGAIREELACVERKLPGDGGKQRICICTSSQCNRPSVAEQFSLQNSHSGGGGHIDAPTTERTSSSPLQQRTASTGSNNKLLEVNSPSIQTEALNCAVCLDVQLSDPNADCRNARAKNCAQELRTEKAYCLTRQTQNGKDGFIVEKSCVSKRQFYQQFPEELEKHADNQVPLGCAATYDGDVNYCICDGQMCNRNSMAQQAEASGSKKPGELRPNVGTPSTSTGTTTSSTTKTSSTKNTAIAGGGAWEQENEMTLGRTADEDSGHYTNKRPLPADLGTSRWTTPTPATSTTTLPATTSSNAVRERLEKWKANSAGGSKKKFSDDDSNRPRDIFEVYSDSNNSALTTNLNGFWCRCWAMGLGCTLASLTLLTGANKFFTTFL